jgi:hypothetical protein
MPKVVRATITALWFGQNCQTRLHFLYEDDTNLAYLQDVAAGIETGFITAVRPAVNSDVRFIEIRVDDLSQGAAGPTFTKQISIQGSASADTASPLALAFVLQLKTGLRGRRNRGRIMMYGQSPGHTTAGVLNTQAFSRWATPIQGLKNVFVKEGQTSGNNYYLIISSGSHGLDQVREVRDIQLRSTPGSQRTRMVGVGN